VYAQFETDDASSLSSVAKRTVWLAVWHSDRFRSNVFLGDVIVPLHSYEFEGRPIWYPLQQQGREVGTTACVAFYLSVNMLCWLTYTLISTIPMFTRLAHNALILRGGRE